jgi:hypothetical protein
MYVQIEYASVLFQLSLVEKDHDLSFLIVILSHILLFQAGCCQALCMLSEVYETSCYPHAWGCAVPVPLLPKETTSKYRRPPTRSLSGSRSVYLIDFYNYSIRN